MANNNEEMIVYPLVDKINYNLYHFIRVENGLIFSWFDFKFKDSSWKSFCLNNFRALANCYWLAMKCDSDLVKSRRRKLLTFLKSIWLQDDIDVSYIMVNAIDKFKDKFTEFELIDYIIHKILPDAGYRKTLVDGVYKWKLMDRIKFKEGIGKSFVLTYINNNFDKDAAWRYVKKSCYLVDGVWCYKNNAGKNRIIETVKEYLKNGGIIVEERNMQFSTFISLKPVDGDNLVGKDRFIGKSEDGGTKKYAIYGAASTTDVDWDDERVSENFIKSMKKQAKGLPLKVISHYNTGDLNQNVGIVKESGGDDKTFLIDGELMPPDKNPNVKKLFDQMDFGIGYGFSIYGKVTKTFREFNQKLHKDITVLDDGQLSHILITDQPANPATFAESIIKSRKFENIGGNKRYIDTGKEVVVKFKHTSSLLKNEPLMKDIKVDELPNDAYPVVYSPEQKVFKEYPHHIVDGDKLFLHKEMLMTAYAKSVTDNADSFVQNHLKNHLLSIGLKGKADELVSIVDKMDEVNNAQEKMNAITVVLKEFAQSIRSVDKLDSTVESKKSMLENVIKEVSPKITSILNNLLKDD